MRKLRLVLALPLELLQLVVAAWLWISSKITVHFVPWVLRGATTHVYWPVIVAKRIVQGTPRWRPIDLTIGIQPHTDEQRAIAAADPNVIQWPACTCGNPKCRNKVGAFAYAPASERVQFTKTDVAPLAIEREIEDALTKTDDNVYLNTAFVPLAEHEALKAKHDELEALLRDFRAAHVALGSSETPTT